MQHLDLSSFLSLQLDFDFVPSKLQKMVIKNFYDYNPTYLLLCWLEWQAGFGRVYTLPPTFSGLQTTFFGGASSAPSYFNYR